MAGSVGGCVPERRLSQYFSWSVTPEAWRDRTVRQRDSVNLSEQRLRPNTFRREQALVFIGDAVSNHLLRCKTLLTEFFQLPYRPVSALLRSNRFSQCLPELNPLMPECFRQPVRQLDSLRLEFLDARFWRGGFRGDQYLYLPLPLPLVTLLIRLCNAASVTFRFSSRIFVTRSFVTARFLELFPL